MAHGRSDSGGGRGSGGTSFIGSFLDTPEQAVIVLRGEVDAAAVERLGVHVRGVLEAGARFVTLDAAAVDSYDAGLLGLLGWAQHRLARRRGLLQVRGLHPRLLPDTVVAAPPAGSTTGSQTGSQTVTGSLAGSLAGSAAGPEPGVMTRVSTWRGR